jgi:hypothetical protein
MSSILTEQDRMKVLAGVLNGDKFVLTCSKHPWYSYGSKRLPNFKCKECAMVRNVGLMCNIPPNKRLEVMEMLEYSTHKLIEAHKRGEINVFELQQKLNNMHMKPSVDVTVEKDITMDESKT